MMIMQPNELDVILAMRLEDVRKAADLIAYTGERNPVQIDSKEDRLHRLQHSMAACMEAVAAIREQRA